MNFSLKIAKRFMIGGKGSGPSRLTGWISIIGLTIGCMAMILSVSILNGFESRVVSKIIGFEGDLRITNVKDWSKFESYISSLNGVKSTMLFQKRKSLLIGRNNSQRMVELKSIEIPKISEFYDLNIKQVNSSKTQQIILGEMTARRLNLNLGDEVRILSPIDNGSAWGLPIQVQCIVSGIFNVQVLDLDDKIAFISKDVGQKLFLRKNGPDGLDIRLDKNSDFQIIANMIKNKFPNIKVNKWSDLHSELFNAMRFERIGALFVLSLIIVVACFNLITTLILVTAQKIRQIGILQVMGCSQKVIKTIIMSQGVMIGSIGITAGLIFGVIIIILQNTYGLIPLPEDVYFISFLPMNIYFYDIITILSISFGMVILSVSIAAKRSTMISTLDAVYLEK
ncbi:MAG: ABC transporter permease [Candidatus Marinimicrobia bacterium]|jgi:lipoprotein-releasing system permease protein|nr:ABC transporter permease [Candidatus Neomarinimicrobiota bacterium]